MKNAWTLQCILSGINHLSDGGVSLRFTNLKDLTSEEKITLIHSHNRCGYLAFSEDELTPDDMPKGNTDGGKTPAQRLRNTLYVAWKQKDGVSDFELYYRHQMEKFINSVKGELDE